MTPSFTHSHIAMALVVGVCLGAGALAVASPPRLSLMAMKPSPFDACMMELMQGQPDRMFNIAGRICTTRYPQD